jgi:Ca2+-binding RTX toxin-like protein
MAVAAVVAAFGFAPAAQAALVLDVNRTATYLALPGEANDVVVTMSAGTPVFTERGSGLFLAGPGCMRLNARQIGCPGTRTLHFELGDRDDRAALQTPMFARALGGDGDDVIVSGSAADQLAGGPGDDVLDGGAGADSIDGGPGRDTADYSLRANPVVVLLDGRPNDGERAESDNVVNVERVLGGAGNDVLVGDAGANELSGGPGDDAIAGHGGADVLSGGPGRDGINADDPVAIPDTVGCGDQRDRVFGDAQDTVRADCEAVDRSGTLGYAAVAGAGADPPVLGESVVVAPVSGVVLIVPPSSDDPGATRDVPAEPAVPLDEERNIPVGSVVDTRLGTVALTSAVDFAGNTQTGQFESGPFQVFQAKQEGATTDLALRGGKEFARCGGRGVQVFSSRRRSVRHLWGDAHGRFRTGGRYASATVRGTRWLTEDRCEGTFVKVVRGAVLVHDAVAGRDVVVAAGESYLARRR